MRLTFICDHKSKPIPRRTALKFPVDSLAWCPECHDLRQITRSVRGARPPRVRGQ